MKKFVLTILIFLLVVLTACSGQKASDIVDSTDNGASGKYYDVGGGQCGRTTSIRKICRVPPGTVSRAMLDTVQRYCAVSVEEIAQQEYENYIKQLKNKGFRVVEETFQEIEGQGYVSSNLLLHNGEKWLSFSYIPNHLELYISLDE